MQLKNKPNKATDRKDLIEFIKQRTFVIKLNRQYEMKDLDNLNPFHDKTFWKICKRYFSNNCFFSKWKIGLTGKGEIINRSRKDAKRFDSYLASVTKSLHLLN